MKKTVSEKIRVTVFADAELYALIQAFAVNRAWSNGKAAEQLLRACFKGTVYSLLTDVKMVSSAKRVRMVRVG